MGVNGAGKSTLLKLVTGTTEPDDGTVALGGSVKMGYFAQHAMELLDGERTVFEWLEDAFPQAGQGSLRALAGCFGFSGDDVEKKCRVLSGGEKRDWSWRRCSSTRRTSWCWTSPPTTWISRPRKC